MDPMTFLSRRFETDLQGELQVGDEVIDSYDIRAIVVRKPYPYGTDRDMFTLIYYGRRLSSVPVSEVRKTGRSFSKELNTIFEALNEEVKQ